MGWAYKIVVLFVEPDASEIVGLPGLDLGGFEEIDSNG